MANVKVNVALTTTDGRMFGALEPMERVCWLQNANLFLS